MSSVQRPFGLKDKLAYMAGDIANDLSFMMSAFFLMLFYTNVLQIEAMLSVFYFSLSYHRCFLLMLVWGDWLIQLSLSKKGGSEGCYAEHRHLFVSLAF